MTEKEIIDSKRWRKLRASVLRRDDYLDREALRFGKRITADTVHHIFPIEFFPEYAFEPWNLISLSRATHNRFHDRTGHYLTSDGLALLDRTARRQGLEISDEMRTKLKNDQG